MADSMPMAALRERARSIQFLVAEMAQCVLDCDRTPGTLEPGPVRTAWEKLRSEILAVGPRLPPEADPLSDWIREVGKVCDWFDDQIRKSGSVANVVFSTNCDEFDRLASAGKRLLASLPKNDPFAFLDDSTITSAHCNDPPSTDTEERQGEQPARNRANKVWPDPKTNTTARIWTRKNGTFCFSTKTDGVKDGTAEFVPTPEGQSTLQMRFMMCLCHNFPKKTPLLQVFREVYQQQFTDALNVPRALQLLYRSLRSLVSDIRKKKLERAGLNPGILRPLAIDDPTDRPIVLQLAGLHRLDDRGLDDADH